MNKRISPKHCAYQLRYSLHVFDTIIESDRSGLSNLKQILISSSNIFKNLSIKEKAQKVSFSSKQREIQPSKKYINLKLESKILIATF